MNNFRWRIWPLIAAVLMSCAPQAAPTPIYITQTPTAPLIATATLQAIPIAIPTPDPLARTNEANAVGVEIMPRNLYDASAGTLEFEVTFTTHTVDLAYDFAALATLRSDSGEEVAALKWDGPNGGHHVFGVLSFPALKARGQTITLVLRDIAGVPERAFEWPATR